MHETTQRTFLVDALDYDEVLRVIDERQIKDRFIGMWPDREQYGRYLLDDNSAQARLQSLPSWLQPYVQLDGTAFVRDLERDGVIMVADVAQGVCIFDGTVAFDTKT